MRDRKEFKTWLKEYRAKAGITQAVLAKTLITTVGIVKSWESGRRVPSKFAILGIKSML